MSKTTFWVSLPWLEQLLQGDLKQKVGKMSARKEHFRKKMDKLQALLLKRIPGSDDAVWHVAI